MLTSRFNGYKVNLVETVEELESLRSLVVSSVKVGLDTETEGLDFNKHQVVGYCVSLGTSYSTEDYQGYYLPVRHNPLVYAKNLPLNKVVDFIQWLLDNFSTWFFNRNFDVAMSSKDGLVYSLDTHFNDAQVLAHLVMQEHLPGLKDCCKKYLKWEMLDFESNNAKDHNFGSTDPRVSYIYAAGDPLATVMLARHLWVNFPYIHKIYPLDNIAVEAVRRLSDSVLYLNRDKVTEEYQEALIQFQALKHEIYQYCGYEFNIGSNPAKAEALSRFVTLTAKTKSGKIAMNAEVLEKIDHPLAQMFRRYAEMQTYISSFAGKLNSFPDSFKASYNSVNVPTGRLSSGAQKGNEYYAPINMQNIPKEESTIFVHLDENGDQYLSLKEEGSIGKVKAKTGIRECFIPPTDEYYWVAMDYSSQEMCVAKGTLVKEKTKGDIPIESVVEGDLVLTSKGYRKVLIKRMTGLRRETLRLELTSGQVLEVTPDHKVRVFRGLSEMWVEAKDIKDTDWVITNGDYWKTFIYLVKSLYESCRNKIIR